MNEKLYLDTLKKYQKWAKENKKQVEQDFTERRAMCEDMQAYSKEKPQSKKFRWNGDFVVKFEEEE